MDGTIDNKIQNILKELSEASADYSERFIKPVIEHRATISHDIFDLALAQERVHLAENQYEIYLAEKFPDKFSQEAKNFLIKEKNRMTRRLRAWTNRQFPARE
jgi:hypothetical protein